jgi:anhydro-N-acetylmuramic acid kinase
VDPAPQRAVCGLPQICAEQPRLVLGLSSGTSADGLDLALLKIQGAGLNRKVEWIDGEVASLRDESRSAVRQAPQWGIADLARWHYRLGDEFAQLAEAFLARQKPEYQRPDFVGSHGQTIYHHDGDPADGTLQIADAGLIAARLRCPVVADFRWNDIAVGGQGAPVSPFADWVLHHDVGPELAILNLGGLANITLLRGSEPPAAWDSGPANGPLDALVQEQAAARATGYVGSSGGVQAEFDVDGRLAASGMVLPDLLAVLKSDPFFQRPLPRSTGLERFGSPLLAKIHKIAPQAALADLLRTCCALAAWAVADSFEHAIGASAKEICLPVYVCGGGGHNPVLLTELQSALPLATFRNYSELHGNPDLREAQAFALLADACFLGEFSAWPSTTGARQPVILGKIVPSCI